MARYMEHPDPAIARTILESELGRTIESVELEHQGLENHTFLVDREWIVRFPREANSRVAYERWALKAVEGKTTLQTPVVEWEGTEWPFLGYRRIPGVKLQDVWPTFDQIAKNNVIGQLADFFCELHESVDSQAARDAGIKLREYRGSCDEIRTWLESGQAPAEWRPFLNERMDCLEASPVEDEDRRFLHFDAHPENVLVDPDTGLVTGIIDFGDAVLGDPHADLAIASFVDYNIIDRLADAYQIRTNEDISRLLVRDHYLIATTTDLAGGYDCFSDVQACYEMWKLGTYTLR